MKLLTVIGASGVLLLSVAGARAETGPTPEMTGAQTTPSGVETTTPPPATYDNGTPATAPPRTTEDTTIPGPQNNELTTVPAESPTQMAIPAPMVQPIEDRDAPYRYQPYTAASRVGVGLLLGGGYDEYTNSSIRNATGSGGFWNVRLIEGTRQVVGFEAAYIGDARGLTGLGFSNNARLVSNGAEGVVRVNVPVARGYSLVEPFGFIGVGWQHYQITNNNNALSDLAAKDDVLTMPFGGGLEYAYRGFMADARFTYRETYFNNLTGRNGGDLNNWGVGAQIGFEY